MLKYRLNSGVLKHVMAFNFKCLYILFNSRAEVMGVIKAVSLTSNPCDDASNALRVFHGELNVKTPQEIEVRNWGYIYKKKTI